MKLLHKIFNIFQLFVVFQRTIALELNDTRSFQNKSKTKENKQKNLVKVFIKSYLKEEKKKHLLKRETSLKKKFTN